jgi:hypothetical protein
MHNQIGQIATNMNLRDRAALALDLTMPVVSVGLETEKVRAIVAAWLDGQNMRVRLVRNSMMPHSSPIKVTIYPHAG